MTKAQEEERQRRQREDKLFSELGKTKEELETLKTLAERISSNGWDLGTLTSQKFNQEPESPQILQMKKEIERLRSDFVKREHDLTKKEKLMEIKNFVEKNSDDFELIKMHGYESKVLELIEHYYKNEKKLLTEREAANAIEEQLFSYHKGSMSEKVQKSKKLKDIYGLAKDENPMPKAKTEAPKTPAKDTAEVKKPIAISTPKMPKLKMTFAGSDRAIESTAFLGKSKAQNRHQLINEIVSNFNASKNN